MLLCQIDEGYLDEFISLKEEEIGNEIVEYLSVMSGYTTEADTRKLLNKYINNYGEKYKICKTCFCNLAPVVTKEHHTELDGYWYEEFVDGYECENCGNKYNY